ncbi:hypothetical protein FOBRF1_009137 [Fusarium oxysporum]
MANLTTIRAVAYFGQPYNISVIDMPLLSIINQIDIVGLSHLLSFGVGSPGYGGLQDAELDYLIIADVFTTGWHSLSYSGFEAGDSVAVFGAGPVGLLAAYSAVLRGASNVYVVDHVESRLELARSIGASTINFDEDDPVAAIMALETEGVTRSLDAVGFESVNSAGQMHTGIVLEEMAAVTSIYGGVGIAGVYNGGGNSTAGAPLAGELPPEIPMPIAALWRKGLHVGAGIVLPLIQAPPLLDLIASGKASPSFVISAEIGIEEAPEYYQRYSNHLESKVVLRFPLVKINGHDADSFALILGIGKLRVGLSLPLGLPLSILTKSLLLARSFLLSRSLYKYR